MTGSAARRELPALTGSAPPGAAGSGRCSPRCRLGRGPEASRLPGRVAGCRGAKLHGTGACCVPAALASGRDIKADVSSLRASRLSPEGEEGDGPILLSGTEKK